MHLTPHSSFASSLHPERTPRVSRAPIAVPRVHPTHQIRPTRTAAPLLPDLCVMGRTWKEWVGGHTRQYGTAPHGVRAIQIGHHKVAIVELRAEPDGYGSISVVGEATPEELSDVLQGILGRFSRAIVDTPLCQQCLEEPSENTGAPWIADDRLHQITSEAFFYDFGTDVATWRQRIRRDLTRGRRLALRVAMERLRAELMVCIAQLQLSN